MKRLPITCIILTYNEERNIRNTLMNIANYVERVVIVDSGSQDKTIHIAREYTNHIYVHPFISYSEQLNWAIKNTSIQTEWVMRLDADEIWPKKTIDELATVITQPDIVGIYIKMRIFFMNKWIKHGGFYPNYFLRIFRQGRAHIENRYMDEHIIVKGKTATLKNDIIEYNRKDRNFSIAKFIEKHNTYSTFEAIEMLVLKNGLTDIDSISSLSKGKTARKRWMKEHFYQKLPLFLRAFFYFLYRYIILMGFLDGREGLIFHFIQGFWYRFLADAKVFEIEQRLKSSDKNIKQLIKEIYGIEI